MKTRDVFPYDRFCRNRSSNTPERSTIDDRLEQHPTPYLSDAALAWALMACCGWVAGMIVLGWI